MHFKEEEPINNVTIPSITDVVSFAIMSKNIKKVTLIVNNCEIETKDTEGLYPENYEENTPIDINFLDGLYLDVKKAGDVKVKVYYTGDKFPTVAFCCYVGDQPAPLQTENIRIEYDMGLIVQWLKKN